MPKFKNLGLSGLMLVVLLLALSACGESTGIPADGDNSSGDNECTVPTDCGDGETCLAIDGIYKCKKMCTTDSECQEDFPGGCCQPIGTASFCSPIYECGSSDGDNVVDGDTVIDGDKDTKCTPDTYSCEDYRTVNRCLADGTWTNYKTCPVDTCCNDGECVLFENEVGTCELDDGCICTPDTYRCRGVKEVQKCASGCDDWVYYRDCEEGTLCINGKCVGGDLPVDGDEAVDGDAEADEPVEECTECNGITVSCEGDNEYCFIEDGEDEGCCRKNCDLTGGSCPRGYGCFHGVCEPVEGYCVSDADCSSVSSYCSKRWTVNDQNEPVLAPDGVCEDYCDTMGYICPSNTTCETNEFDVNFGKCVSTGECITCSNDYQCQSKPGLGPGYYCNVAMGQYEGCCIAMCSNDNPCTGQLSCCPDGRCGVNCGTTCSKDCPAGEVCDPLYDECVLDCPPCEEGSCCTRDSAPQCMPGCTCETPIMCGFLLRSCCPGQTCSAFIYGVYGFCS